MNKQYIRIITAVLGIIFLINISAYAQSQKTVSVKDENGNPVPGATVTIGETGQVVTTDDKGQFVLPVDTRNVILVEAGGFESKTVVSVPPTGVNEVVLKKVGYLMDEKNNVDVPFGKFKKRQITGSATSINPDDVLNYDQESNYTGLLNGIVPGLYGATNIRGTGTALIVIDGIPRPSVTLSGSFGTFNPASELNVQQIKKITVLKDISSSMLYGGQGNNGVILINTRRGEAFKKSMRFTVTSGFNKPISYPKYINAVDYMTLYNEALSNDGFPAKYPQTIIDNTASGIDPVRYPDQSYYNSTFLKNWTSSYKVTGEASGGNEIATYYLNLGWTRETGLIKVGEGVNEKNDNFNMHGNIDCNITDMIKLRFIGSALFKLNREPRYAGGNFWNASTTLLPDIYPHLIPIDLIKDEALLQTLKPVNGNYVLGGTSEYRNNIWGDLTFNGPSKDNTRLISVTTALDFDLSSITPGLKASSYLSLDMLNIFGEFIGNTYAVYKPNYLADTINSFTRFGTDAKVTSLSLSDMTFYRRFGFYGTIDYSRQFGDHSITFNTMASRDLFSTEGQLQPLKHLNVGFRANYSYQNRFIAELSGVFGASIKLRDTDPWGFSPGLGLAWVLSEESFLKDNSAINFLKIRTNIAVLQNDERVSNYFLDRDLYSASGSFSYNQGSSTNTGYILSSGNLNLSMEKDMNYNIGFDAVLLNNKLFVEGGYFYYKMYNMIDRRLNSLPGYFSALPYENFESSQIQGSELGLNYNTNYGKLQMRAGANIVYSVPKALVLDELNYIEEYRKQTGKASDGIFGLVADGLFLDQPDIDNSPLQAFGPVQPGDIKYKDLNNDNIVDDQDQKMIGNSQARVQYGLNLSLKYKGVELFLLGTGQIGQNRSYTNSYYWVYGTRKYSEVVLDRWTPATAATATYPRLTSQTSGNNFKTSTFWMEKYNYFSLQTAQLNYTLPIKIAGITNARIFARGGNLLLISKVKEKAQLNIGTAPQMRNLTFGLTVVL